MVASVFSGPQVKLYPSLGARQDYTTDSEGRFLVEVADAPSPSFTLTILAGNNEQTFTLNWSGNSPGISITGVIDGDDFTCSNSNCAGDSLYSTASLTARVTVLDGKQPVSNVKVTWSVISARNNFQVMFSGWGSKKSGLTWGDMPESGLTYQELSQERITSVTATTDDSGETTQQLTDIVGERVITVEAKVNIGGNDYTDTRNVSFGNGPLSVFKAPVGTTPQTNWNAAYQYCNDNSPYPGTDHTAASGWANGAYVGGDYTDGVSTNNPASGNMPTRAEIQAVSHSSTQNPNPISAAQGAAFAAGWPNSEYYGTGEASGEKTTYRTYLSNGYAVWHHDSGYNYMACRR
jgi:hypothetical protein